MILYLKNIKIEGPELVKDYFDSKGYESQIVELSLNHKLPEVNGDIQAVVCLGGPMNVYEEQKYPFLKAEDLFIKEVLRKEIPYLGICLGAQLLAKASSAKVLKADQKELGFMDVSLTLDGSKDPIFYEINKTFDVFQWHEDTFELPANAQLLATSQVCKNQSFKIGKNAYGMQFHFEINDYNIKQWCEEYIKEPVLREAMMNRMLNSCNHLRASLKKTNDIICDNFSKIILNS